MESYPSCEDVRDPQIARAWMPQLLQVFLDNLICHDGKKTALGHCIVQAVRPRTVTAPIPFALEITVDNICASKYLLNLLHTLGMSISYDEVRRFRQSVVRSESIDLPLLFPHSFTQYAADNVDHDACTLDGSGTLHAMEIISVSKYTAGTSKHDTSKECIRRMKIMKSADVVKMKKNTT
jgi:hypothetical protein